MARFIGDKPTVLPRVAPPALRRALEKAVECLTEVRASHRDKHSADYNNCEDDQCAWCGDAEVALTGLAALLAKEMA